MAIPKRTDGADERGFLTRLRRDKSGNTLALATAGIVALMGMIGGAVDMSRSYMVQSRLQQACDAGALSARKAMDGETLTEEQKEIGNRFFDFNFPDGTLGATLTSRVYTQPTSTQGTPQAIVNGTIIATVPTTIMRAFGNESVDLTVTCSSKMEVQSADVAMVLDVTGSMGTAMRIRAGSSATETRMAALRRAVRAFYNALGPGRAGGDLSKGRVRYAFAPYNTAINTGYLLSHAQMVDSFTYQSREAVSNTVHGWSFDGYETSVDYTDWSLPTGTDLNEVRNSSNYGSWTSISSSSGNETFTNLDGSNGSLPRRRNGFNSSTCASSNNNYPGGSGLAGVSLYSATTPDEDYSDVAPVYPQTHRVRNYESSRTASVRGWRYAWVSSSCRLQYASGKTSSPNTRYTQTRTGTSTRRLDWGTYTGVQLVYGQRTIDVSGLKALLGGWNTTLTIPRMNQSGSVSRVSNVYRSGTLNESVYQGGTAQNRTVAWRGCVEERTTVNTITGSTSVDSVPSGAFDLDTTLLANSSQDNTRWRPFLPDAVFNPGSESSFDDDSCPAPALKLQEIGDYDGTVFETNYPNLFRTTSGSPTSHYFPFQSGGSNAWKNVQTIRNYIDRMPYSGGTIHDAGFIWGLHLVSGEGMFAAENPDRWNGQAVSRNIVFMTDGKMEPPANSYVFSGYNRYDGRITATSADQDDLIAIHNRRLRILCEAAKRQGITVWVVVVSSGTAQDYDDLRACASSSGTFKSAETSDELIQSFTTIAQSIGGLRISQ